MSDQSKESLREISHLFLSNVRDMAGNGAPRPQRIPPAKQQQQQPPPSHSLDMTPQEFAQMFGGLDDADDSHDQAPDRGLAPVPHVHAIIGAHLNGKQFDRAKQYARHLASTGLRVGLIEVDASEFRVMCFDRADGDATHEASSDAETSFDPRRMNEVLEELSWDVQRWLLVLPQIRVPEARGLLRECSRWVLLSTCDHDGVIACYRTLKGLTDLWPGGATPDKPQLSLALLDATDTDQAERVSAKLVSVCQQFLNWPVDAEPTVDSSQPVAEHLVMCARPTRDKGQLAAAPQWEIVADLIARSKLTVAGMTVEPMQNEEAVEARFNGEDTEIVDANESASAATESKIPSDFEPVMRSIPMPQTQEQSMTMGMRMTSRTDRGGGEISDVIDLPIGVGESTDASIIDAILHHCSSELIECPIAPPMCPRARLAVGRDRRVVMLAVAKHGLSDLNTIGLAYKWLQENQNLIGMAVPQLSIDTQQAPHLSLLIDQADSAAQTLQPMLQGEHVTVKTYRKLRWGGKTGLLLEAA